MQLQFKLHFLPIILDLYFHYPSCKENRIKLSDFKGPVWYGIAEKNITFKDWKKSLSYLDPKYTLEKIRTLIQT